MIIKYWKSMLVIVIILVLSFAKFPSFNYLHKTISWDKLVHICMYFALAFILLYDYSRSKGEKNRKWMLVLICVFFPVVFGGMILPVSAIVRSWFIETGKSAKAAAISPLSTLLESSARPLIPPIKSILFERRRSWISRIG